MAGAEGESARKSYRIIRQKLANVNRYLHSIRMVRSVRTVRSKVEENKGVGRRGRTGWFERAEAKKAEAVTVRELRGRIAREIHLDLTNALFDPPGRKLLPAAGASRISLGPTRHGGIHGVPCSFFWLQ